MEQKLLFEVYLRRRLPRPSHVAHGIEREHHQRERGQQLAGERSRDRERCREAEISITTVQALVIWVRRVGKMLRQRRRQTLAAGGAAIRRDPNAIEVRPLRRGSGLSKLATCGERITAFATLSMAAARRTPCPPRLPKRLVSRMEERTGSVN
jgi:hypothetical protein